MSPAEQQDQATYVCLKCRNRFNPVNELDPFCPGPAKDDEGKKIDGRICESRDTERIIDDSRSKLKRQPPRGASPLEAHATVVVTVAGRGDGQRKRIAEEIAQMFTMSGRKTLHFRMGKPPSIPKDVDVAIVEDKANG